MKYLLTTLLLTLSSVAMSDDKGTNLNNFSKELGKNVDHVIKNNPDLYKKNGRFPASVKDSTEKAAKDAAKEIGKQEFQKKTGFGLPKW